MLRNIHPKYIIKVAPKGGKPLSHVHQSVHGSIATVIDLTIGKRGSIAYYVNDLGFCPWHRLYTSPIEDVTVDLVGNILVTTKNTLYQLTRITD